MSKSHHGYDVSPSSSQLLQQHHHHNTTTTVIHHRSRNVFILKSLSIIVTLTIVVLGINYYLISNCPSSTSSSSSLSSQQPNNNEVSLVLLPEGGKKVEEENAGRIEPVVISVYYEILCPDSKSFILRQLVPVERKYKNLVRIRYIPFGKASYRQERNNDDKVEWQFSCQHGPEECHGNKLHSCVIESYPGNESLQTQIIGCSMERYRLWGSTVNSITSVTTECRNLFAPADSSPLLCNNASALLAAHGHETLSLSPPVSFIPTIAIDGSLSNQRHILRDLDTVVCKSVKRRLAGLPSATKTSNLNLNC